MMKQVIALLALVCLQSSGFGLQAQPKTYVLDPTVLEGVRSTLAGGSTAYAAAVKSLRTAAEKALNGPLPSVVTKTRVPPSGDKHDYMSMGKYWWPDPASKDGLPYIRRDGEVNPEAKGISDDANWGVMTHSVYTLALASYYCGDQRYADRAVLLLRTWFLDSLTRMNPNLNYAQAVAGKNDGRGSGIIDTHLITEVIDALGLLEETPSFTPEDRAGMRVWFRDYLRWLHESKNGKREAMAENNHGSWYDVQIVAVSLYLGDREHATAVLTQACEKRIAAQIEPDGTQPKELVRTRSFGYSLFNLEALSTLARMGERLGVDLWNFKTTDGRGFRTALDHLLPYVSGEKRWEGKQLGDVRFSTVYPMLMEAARVYHDNTYADAAWKLPDVKKFSQQSLLLLGQR